MALRRLRRFTWGLAGILLLTLVLMVAQRPEGGYRPVTDTRLLSPDPADWLMYRRTFDSWGYSPLDQITTANVADLAPIFFMSTGLTSAHQSPPIVNDGVMFVTTPDDQVIALNMRTGEQLWRHRRQFPPDMAHPYRTNRGVGLYGDKVYYTTHDAFVVALDAMSGEMIWETQVADYRVGYYMNMAPLVADGKVMVGPSGGERGIRGFVAALHPETGREIWRSHTIPAPGEPGHETWHGETWRTGGAAIWGTGSYDPDLNLTYWGTGNAGPWTGDQRPGDNLYANSVVAFDADTGELKGYHQYHHNGSWDWDEVSAPLLIDVPRNGRVIKTLVHPGRSGYLWLLERTAEAIRFVDAQPYVHQNVFTAIDPITGRPTYDLERKPGVGKPAQLLPVGMGRKELATGRLQPADPVPVHSGERESLLDHRRHRSESRAGPRLHRRFVARLRARRRRSHRRAPGLESRHGRAGMDARVRHLPELGARTHHRRRSGVRRRDQRRLLSRIRCRDGRGALGTENLFRGHGRAVVVCDRRRASTSPCSPAGARTHRPCSDP